ncbi:hypothetical protein ADT26_04590 [Xanthomonas oryzae]|uniref:hypothetical protein n=1 Tax=Xanthomonas oryzae TaxID=347 RepID=UPI0005198A2C|nr:hypothetical protein [Xanthomonas oryzae]ALS94371.1 hypothetical protein AXO1947_07375 [Xanthomonas oryzae pv. oryzae]AUI91067.1 hypothetical protein BVV16_14265 [Xanthomonas oryzae pv. oryzae]AUI94738.1 hypothetical protein BVV17_14270 [Xanthomonas oryzae pv. oryzae]AUI98410.1 hypothetical protein BVV18_14275 [Xanthomonas oryzae pv. oryzae]AUJ02086.1 hypothetical protein BVV10_14275 [Xanthomonas oryzae pv. oryzae]
MDEKIASARKVKVGQRDWSTDVTVTEAICNITVAVSCRFFNYSLKKKMIGAADLQRTDPVLTTVIDLGPTQQQRDTLAKEIA